MEDLTLLFLLLSIGSTVLASFRPLVTVRFLALVTSVLSVSVSLTDPSLGDRLVFLILPAFLCVLFSIASFIPSGKTGGW